MYNLFVHYVSGRKYITYDHVFYRYGTGSGISTPKIQVKDTSTDRYWNVINYYMLIAPIDPGIFLSNMHDSLYNID